MTTLREQSREQARKPPDISNLTQRIITALILLPVVLVATYFGGWVFTFMVGTLAVIAALEFYVLARGRPIQGSAVTGIAMLIALLLAFQLNLPLLWYIAIPVGIVATFIIETIRHPDDVGRSFFQCVTTLAGVLYIGFPAAFAIAIRVLPDGFIWMGVIYALSWGTDTFAYIGGRLAGRTKLAPSLSPGKTVEGAIVGVVGGIIPTVIWLWSYGKLSWVIMPLVALGPLVAILGDLMESGIKRLFQAKDSHVEGLDIMPGHGGVLDRVDSLLLVIVVCYFYLIVAGVAA